MPCTLLPWHQEALSTASEGPRQSERQRVTATTPGATGEPALATLPQRKSVLGVGAGCCAQLGGTPRGIYQKAPRGSDAQVLGLHLGTLLRWACDVGGRGSGLAGWGGVCVPTCVSCLVMCR